jgi:hypothetical protein
MAILLSLSVNSVFVLTGMAKGTFHLARVENTPHLQLHLLASHEVGS